MSPPVRPRRMTTDPTKQWLLTDDGSYTLWDARLDETFHSGCGAVSESLTVYLRNSGVADRLRQRQPTLVIEYGLGTGTSFLLTAALAEACRTPLRYVALEINLLRREIISQLDLKPALHSLHSLPELNVGFPNGFMSSLENVQAALLAAWPLFQEDQSTALSPFELTRFVTLELLLGDGRSCPRVREHGGLDEKAHAIYFDPFAPEKDPGLWNAQVFHSTYRLLTPGGTLTSYCVKSSVRHLLQSVGYQVEKLPGPPGGKREVLRATKPTPKS